MKRISAKFNKILGLAMIFMMSIGLFVSNVSAATSGAAYFVSPTGLVTFYDEYVLNTVGEKKYGVTLKALDINAITGELTLDKDVSVYHIFTVFDTTINLNGNNEIKVVEEAKKYTVKGEGTLTLSALSYFGNAEEKDKNGELVCNKLWYVANANNPEEKTAVTLPSSQLTMNMIKAQYEEIKGLNAGLPEVFAEDNFTCETRLVSQLLTKEITEDWVKEHIITDKNVKLADGKLIIYDKEEDIQEPGKEETGKVNFLTTSGLVFESKNPLDSGLSVTKTDLMETMNKEDITNLESQAGNKALVGLYDISVVDSDNNVVPMKNGEFTIKIKLTEEMKKYNHLIAAYIKDGKIVEKFDVKIDGDYAVFNTTHLSWYGVLGENIANVENPNTGDSIAFFITIALIGVIGLSISYTSIKKRA